MQNIYEASYHLSNLIEYKYIVRNNPANCKTIEYSTTKYPEGWGTSACLYLERSKEY